MLECEGDLEIVWNYGTGELRLFGWPTADAGTESHRMWQATWRSERLVEHLHSTQGHLSSHSDHVGLTLTHFAWHRPFYHPWRLAFSAPMSYPFELFACWLAAPLTAVVAIAVCLTIGNDPHFAGIPDLIAQLPMACMFLCGIHQRVRRRHALTLVKVGLVALIDSMHYWHVALLVYEIWHSHNPDINTAWGAISISLLVLPTTLTLVICFVLVLTAISSKSDQLIDAALVRAHPRSVAVTILLSALHIELISMIPWSKTSWAGLPTRNALLCVVAMLILQKSSAMVLSAHFVHVEPNAFGVYLFVFSAVCLVQVLIEKAVLVVGSGFDRAVTVAKADVTNTLDAETVPAVGMPSSTQEDGQGSIDRDDAGSAPTAAVVPSSPSPRGTAGAPAPAIDPQSVVTPAPTADTIDLEGQAHPSTSRQESGALQRARAAKREARSLPQQPSGSPSAEADPKAPSVEAVVTAEGQRQIDAAIVASLLAKEKEAAREAVEQRAAEETAAAAQVAQEAAAAKPSPTKDESQFDRI